MASAKRSLESAGLFLQQTRRLHPDICDFTAELFYENRLSAYPGLERQAVLESRFPEAGLVYVPVRHQGRQARAEEEVRAIADIVAELTTRGTIWRDKDGVERALDVDDLMIVAPYNAQVTALSAAIPAARIGTVDKFQGAAGAGGHRVADDVHLRRSTARHELSLPAQTD